MYFEVPVLHQSVVNVVAHSSAEIVIVQGRRVLQFMAVSFDGLQGVMWKSLSNGATLVFRGEKDILASLATVHVLGCTPTALAQFGYPEDFPNLKVVSVVGEVCPIALKNRWSVHCKMMNLYGPSECAIMTHLAALTSNDRITIGRSVPNVNCYVLDSNFRSVPTGCIGEIFLGGICVSPGYINLPVETQKRFLDDPFAGRGGRMYRTGDLGHLLPDGNFEVLGRLDSQV